MPEGPELHLSSQYINSVCTGRLFSGKIRRNPIHKCSDITWDVPLYTVSAVSRGKELKVFLQEVFVEKDKNDSCKPSLKPRKKNLPSQTAKVQPRQSHILFNFGMSGKFEFTSEAELPKHAHLSFFTEGDPRLALSFVDYRRFGKWQEGADWSVDRGPCCMFEYTQFRSNVLANLSDSAFNKPLCEVLLNQKYFNGIGNYLRAEICFRAKIRPFEQARSIFVTLPDAQNEMKAKYEEAEIKSEDFPITTPDILELCNHIPLEVIGLGTSFYLPEDEDNDMSKFSQWLQCYYKPGMKNIADHNKRTMWYYGDPGPLVPKEGGAKKRHATYDKKLSTNSKKAKAAAASPDIRKEKEEDRNLFKEAKQTGTKGANRQAAGVRSPIRTRGSASRKLESLSTSQSEKLSIDQKLVKSKKGAVQRAPRKNANARGEALTRHVVRPQAKEEQTLRGTSKETRSGNVNGANRTRKQTKTVPEVDLFKELKCSAKESTNSV